MNRPAMRLLSARLRTLQSAPRCTTSIGPVRSSSRYSRPSSDIPRPSSDIPRPSSETSQPSSETSQPSSEPPFVFKMPEPVQVPSIDNGRVVIDTYNPMADEESARKAETVRSMRIPILGLILSQVALAFILYNIDLDELEKQGEKNRNKNKEQLDASQDSNDRFQGRNIHVIGAGEDKRILAEGEQEVELVQTGSGSVPYFPRRLYLPAAKTTSSTSPLTPTPLITGNDDSEDEYTLVGLGIRTVTFLGIEVYVMGMYVRTKDISAIQSRFIHLVNPLASTLVPSEKEQLRTRLLDPTSSTEIWETLLREEGIRSVWRVVPSKNTDFAHLRDGWMNGIKRATAEVKTYITSGPALTEYNDDSFGQAVKSFRDMFTGGGRAPKDSVILLMREASGALEVLFQDPKKTQSLESIGRVTDPRIGRLLWMGYLAGRGVSSESARKNIVDGYVEFAARPLGTVETMVR